MRNFLYPKKSRKLKLLPKETYITIKETDPLIYYFWPIIGGLYRKRVELALAECTNGHAILEVGYGSGITFPILNEKYEVLHGVDLFADADAVKQMWLQRGINPHLKRGNLLLLPYPSAIFDTVLLISVLEHLKPNELSIALQEVFRVLKPGGQMVYGVPVERQLMRKIFTLMGVDISKHHFSSESSIAGAARFQFQEKSIVSMNIPFFGKLYEVGNFTKAGT